MKLLHSFNLKICIQYISLYTVTCSWELVCRRVLQFFCIKYVSPMSMIFSVVTFCGLISKSRKQLKKNTKSLFANYYYYFLLSWISGRLIWPRVLLVFILGQDLIRAVLKPIRTIGEHQISDVVASFIYTARFVVYWRRIKDWAGTFFIETIQIVIKEPRLG